MTTTFTSKFWNWGFANTETFWIIGVPFITISKWKVGK